jgi:hypothetical protein
MCGQSCRTAHSPSIRARRSRARERLIQLALDEPTLSPRELAVRFTDTASYFVSEASVYRLLKARDLIASPAFIVIKAAAAFKDKTTAPNLLWQTDFTYLKVIGWGWFYLSTVLDDFSRYIVAWKLHQNEGRGCRRHTRAGSAGRGIASGQDHPTTAPAVRQRLQLNRDGIVGETGFGRIALVPYDPAMAPLSYSRHRFPPAIIQHAIWLYLRFTLSYREVEDLLAERDLESSYETVRRWVLEIRPADRAQAAAGPRTPGRAMAPR